MPTGDGTSRFPVFLGSSNHPRCPGYVPGRVAPVRSPPPAKAPPPPPSKPCGLLLEQQPTSSFSEVNQRRERVQNLQRRKNTLICCGMSLGAFFLTLILVFCLKSRDVLDENCPDHNLSLSSWNPGHQPDMDVFVRRGYLLRLESSATMRSLTIQSGGRVVFADSSDGSKTITLRTHYILIEGGGSFHIGSPKCRYRSRATIALMGRSDDTIIPEVPGFGRKFIGVMGGGTLELHGAERISWSLLTRTIPASGLTAGDYSFQRNFHRGINLRVVDQDTAAIVFSERYDTYELRNDSRRLTQLLRSLPAGRIVAVAVGDSADKNFLDETKKAFAEILGSRFAHNLKYREAWALVSVVGGDNSSCSEAVREHENLNTGGRAVARRNFTTPDGVSFSVTAYSEWKTGKPQYTHVGEVIDGVDMRAEVALLSRNILIYGEMENSCYGDFCQYFNYDTFGGHIKVFRNFSSVHLSHVELKNMGQQREKGRYPVHFHMCGDVDQLGGYSEPTYVDGLSIHHSFSRCLTIHATNGLLVKNTVGYDTLGHCFFMEDGIEQRNTLFHNLGLLTRPGTLLPTDRNETVCVSMKENVYKGYTPSPSTEFYIVYFISKNLVNSSRLQIIFYVILTSSLAGLFIDKGVKTTYASAADPREYLCLENSARFRPHLNADPNQPRVAAVIDTLISFKNNDLGAWIRGGDIIIQNSGFADNGVGLSFASDGSYPKDEGSSQEVKQSLFVGESRNRGNNGGQNKYWGPGGVDGKFRTLPRNRTFPIRGFQIYDGPLRVIQSTFRGFVQTPERFTSAVGFNLKNNWQLTPRNNLSQLSFHPDVKLQAFFGRPGQWFEGNDLDGDKNSIFHDVDGSVTGYPDTYAGRADNYLIQHPACVKLLQWNAVTCSGRYSQVFIQTQGAPNLMISISRDEYPDAPLVLRGTNSQGALSQQYQPVLMMSKSYTLHWNGPAPRETVLSLINFDKEDWVLVGLCYPSDTTFQIMSDIYNRQLNTFEDITDYGTVSSLAQLEARPMERKYFFDRSVGLLWFYLQARYNRDGHSYCSTKGCERVKVMATTTSKQTCNCTAKAYPKYSKTPSAVVPMPTQNTLPCKDCGAKQVCLVFSSEPWTSYLKTQVKSLGIKQLQNSNNVSFITVNEITLLSSKPGFFIVSVDACSGKVTKKNSFARMDAKMEQFLKTGIPNRSIVLMATQGQPEGLRDLAPHLVSFGLAKAPDLLNKGLWGFQGDSPSPSWVSLQTGEGEDVLELQERYIPLNLEVYGCLPPTAHARKDLELLRKSTGLQ
uniref:hyaluronoglucosaminidase n=1 Tax=Oryzias sinensis TaxID=183150 RepID=A0A8C7ZSG7_9TELE